MAGTGSDELLRALGVAIRTFRLARGLTHERLAEVSGLHTTYISDIERGRRNIGFVNLDRLTRALATDLVELMAAVEAERRR